MAYAVQVTERLEGLCISQMETEGKDEHFAITDMLDTSLAEKIGISVGDTILSLNRQPFPELAKEGGFGDPNCILWDTALPFTMTLIPNKDQSKRTDSDEIAIDALDDHCELSVEVKEEIMDNVKYVKNIESLKMIVDNSDPLCIVSERWMKSI